MADEIPAYMVTPEWGKRTGMIAQWRGKTGDQVNLYTDGDLFRLIWSSDLPNGGYEHGHLNGLILDDAIVVGIAKAAELNIPAGDNFEEPTQEMKDLWAAEQEACTNFLVDTDLPYGPNPSRMRAVATVVVPLSEAGPWYLMARNGKIRDRCVLCTRFISTKRPYFQLLAGAEGTQWEDAVAHMRCAHYSKKNINPHLDLIWDA